MSTYVFDMDGTFCTQQKSEEYHLAKPIPQMIDKMNGLYLAGHHIIIFTARGMKTYQKDVSRVIARYDAETRDWLDKNGVLYHELIFGKPIGDVYIDDKGVNANDFIDL